MCHFGGKGPYRVTRGEHGNRFLFKGRRKEPFPSLGKEGFPSASKVEEKKIDIRTEKVRGLRKKGGTSNISEKQRAQSRGQLTSAVERGKV